MFLRCQQRLLASMTQFSDNYIQLGPSIGKFRFHIYRLAISMQIYVSEDIIEKMEPR